MRLNREGEKYFNRGENGHIYIYNKPEILTLL